MARNDGIDRTFARNQDLPLIALNLSFPLSCAQAIEALPIWRCMRIGHGYDVHRLVPGRKLILGGVEIPFELGLEGHSDADVLVHAVMDALLGAAGLGDIGQHFPDTSPQYAGISSMKLLALVREKLFWAGFDVGNVDATVIAQRPKLRDYILQMEENIADTLGVDREQINVKATTEEHLGFTGDSSGMACHAVCLLMRL